MIVTLLTRINHSEGFRRIVLIVYTHADHERGDLVYHGDAVSEDSSSTGIHNVSIANSITPHPLIQCQFFENIVGEELKEFILESNYSMLVLAACGSVVNTPTALDELKQVTKEYVIPSLRD